MTRACVWLGSASLLCLAACADLWGFNDLTIPADAAPADGAPSDGAPVDVTAADQSTRGDSNVSASDGASEDGAEVEDSSEEDAGNSGSRDGGPVDDGGDSGADSGGSQGDGGDAGHASDASDAAPSGCQQSCLSGCCSAQGQCQPGNVLGACGTGGRSCEDCSAAAFKGSCGGVTTPCCTTQMCQCSAVVCL
jgi:hypothetical protein